MIFSDAECCSMSTRIIWQRTQRNYGWENLLGYTEEGKRWKRNVEEGWRKTMTWTVSLQYKTETVSWQKERRKTKTGPSRCKTRLETRSPAWHRTINPFVPTVAFSQLCSNMCCPRDCVSRHNGRTSGAPLKTLRVDSALRALSTLRGFYAERRSLSDSKCWTHRSA